MKALPALDARTYLPGAPDADLQQYEIAEWSAAHCAGRILDQLYRLTAWRDGRLLGAHLCNEQTLIQNAIEWRDDEGTAYQPEKVEIDWLGDFL